MGKFKYNGTGVEPTDFSPVPPGNYTMVITNYTEKTNKHGLPSYRIESKIDGGQYDGKKVWYNVNLLPNGNAGAGIAIHFLKTIGEPWHGEIDVDADNWIGRRFDARVAIVKNINSGKDQNEIDGVSVVHDGNVMNQLVKDRWVNSKLDDESVPF